MTDAQLLYLCLTGFYLLECVHWLPPGSVSFRSWRPGGRWRLGRSKLEFTLAGFQPHVGPLLPAGGFFAATEWPLLIEEDGTRLGRSHPHAGELIPWTMLDLQTEDRTLWLASGRQVAFASPTEALRVARLLLKLVQAKATGRQAIIDAWWTSTTHPARARRVRRLRRLIQRKLGFSSWMVFGLCFGIIPAVYWFVGWKGPALPMAAALLGVAQLEVTVRRFCIEKRILKRSAGDRWLEAFQTFLLPVHAMKAAESVGARLVDGIHPATMGTVLLQRTPALECVGRFWREWRFSRPHDPFQAAQDRWLPRITLWMQSLGWTEAELETPPPAMAGDERFCPRCHAWHAESGTLCQDCGGLPTIQAGP